MRFLLPIALLACVPDETDTGAQPPEPVPTPNVPSAEPESGLVLQGVWLDDYGFDHVITDASWESYGSGTPVRLTQYDNAEGWTVGQNDPGDLYFPNLWSRFDWIEASIDGRYWFCQTAFSAPSEAEALAHAPADPSNPAAFGCGGAPWSLLRPN